MMTTDTQTKKLLFPQSNGHHFMLKSGLPDLPLSAFGQLLDQQSSLENHMTKQVSGAGVPSWPPTSQAGHLAGLRAHAQAGHTQNLGHLLKAQDLLHNHHMRNASCACTSCANSTTYMTSPLAPRPNPALLQHPPLLSLFPPIPAGFFGAPAGHFAEGYNNTDWNAVGRRKNATRETTAALKSWLGDHLKNPYPTKGEKVMLAIITKMSLTQVSTWFANARRRLKKEGKMTWTPRNSYDDDDDEDDDNDSNDNGEMKSLDLTIAEDDEGFTEDELFTPKETQIQTIDAIQRRLSSESENDKVRELEKPAAAKPKFWSIVDTAAKPASSAPCSQQPITSKLSAVHTMSHTDRIHAALPHLVPRSTLIQEQLMGIN